MDQPTLRVLLEAPAAELETLAFFALQPRQTDLDVAACRGRFGLLADAAPRSRRDRRTVPELCDLLEQLACDPELAQLVVGLAPSRDDRSGDLIEACRALRSQPRAGV